MKSFAQYLEERNKSLVEALTIPEDPSDKIEMALRQKMKKGWTHGDRAIRWYRNAKKAGEPSSRLLSVFVNSFSNIEDLFKTYEKYLADLKRMKLLKKIDVQFQNGKTLSVDPVKDIDKIRRLEGFQMLVKAMGDLVHSDQAIDTDAQKHALDANDRKSIKILGSSAHVVLWQTQGYETTNKFVYQLWQNDKTLGRGDVYGDPEEQTPYCTHSKQHWDDYSSKFGSSYKQFWFLQKTGPCPAGDLTNAGVVKAFNALKGMGPRVLIGMNDSGNDMLDRDDEPVDNWKTVLRGAVSPSEIDHLTWPDEVVDLTKKILYVQQQEHEFQPITTAIDPDKKKRSLENGSKPQPVPEHFTGRKIEVICSDYRDWGVRDDNEMRRKMNAMHFPKSVDVLLFDIEENYGSQTPVYMPCLPEKVKAAHFTLMNIQIKSPIEVECGHSMSLSQMDQNSCSMLKIAPTKVMADLSRMSLDNLQFLPSTTRSLQIRSSASVKTYEGAPFNDRLSLDIQEDSNSRRGTKDSEYDTVVNWLGYLGNISRKKKILSVWQRDGRFHSIAGEIGESATDTVVDFLSWHFTPGWDLDGRKGKDILDFWVEYYPTGKKHRGYDIRAYEFLSKHKFI